MRLPPGRARLATSPDPNGSPAIKTIGKRLRPLLRRPRSRGTDREQDVHLGPDQLRHELGEAVVAALGPSGLKREGLALHVAQVAQALAEGVEEMLARARGFGPKERDLPRVRRRLRLSDEQRPRGGPG